MKKINLIEWLWKTDSHEKQKPQRFARYAAILIMLLTLGVGQMWADAFWPYAGFYEVYMTYSYSGNNSNYTFYSGDNNSSQSVDLGTLTADFKVNSLYLKCYKNTGDWSKYGNLCGGLMIYNTGSGDNEYQPTWTWTDKNTWNNDYQAHLWEISKTSCNKVIASYNSGASGSYTAKLAFKMWGSDDNGSDCGDIWWISNNSNNYKFNYKIAPPAISSFSVAESGYISGSGTSEDPYIMPYNGTLTLTVSGSKGRTDANSTIKYWKNSGDKQNSNVLTVTGITSTTKTSVVVHAQCINNSSSSLVGTESTKTVWYKSEAAYSVTVSNDGHGTTSPSGAQSNIGTLSGLTISATPSTGYTFNTWTISSGSGSFTSTATTASNKFKPTAASTITASFNAKTYSITLDDDGDYGGNGSATATYNGTALDISKHASRDGWNLVGYFAGGTGEQVTDASGNLLQSKRFQSGGNYYDITNSSSQWIYDGDLTLYAHWSKEYSVTYNANGGTGTTTDANSPYEAGSNVTVLSNSFTRSGYSFTGWNTSAEGDGTPYAAGATISSIAANVTLYAQWSENDYTVTVNAGSHGSVASGSVTGHKDTKVTLPTATANTGYHFDTWTTTLGSVTYTNQTSATSAQVNGLTAAATVRADFAANTYSVVFNANGGTGSMSNEAFTYDAAAKALTSNSFTKSGYTFVGWATSAARANAMNIDYTNGQSVQNLTSTNGGTFNLYAVWAKKYYIGGRFQHDWEDGATTTNEMTYVSDGRYKFVTSKTVSELSVQWHNVSGDYYEDQVFFIHTGSGKSGSSSNPFYTTPNEDGAGLNFETSNSYSNALVLANQETTWGEIVTNRLVQFSNVDNLSSSVIIWWEPSTKKIWYEATESLNTNYYLLGFGSGNWGETEARRFKVASVNATTATVSVTLTAKTYTGGDNEDGFKVENGGAYYGNTGTMTRANCSNWDFTGGDHNNCGITADLAGTYTFTLNLSTKAVSVTYPTAYTVNFGVSPAGSASAPSNNLSISDGALVASGTSITFTKAAANTGYTWSHWENNGSDVGSGNTYTTTISGNTTVNAVYTEDMHTVSVVANDGYGNSHGSVSTASVTAGIATKSAEITATPENKAWRFKHWVIAPGISAADGYDTHSNPLKINATTDDITLIAYFEPRYALMGSLAETKDPAGGMPSPTWSDESAVDFEVKSFTAINTDNGVDLECTRTLEPNKTYKFQVYDREIKTPGAYNEHTRLGLSSATVLPAGESVELTVVNGSGDVRIQTVGRGDYTFKITKLSSDATNNRPTITVERQASWLVSIGQGYEDVDGGIHSNTSTGGTISATATESGTTVSITNGQYIANGGKLDWSVSPASGYTFSHYYGSANFSGASFDFTTINPVNAAANVYAKFTENRTTVNLVASPAGKGTIQIGGADETSTTAGVTTKPSVTAVPIPGYYVNTSSAVWTKNNDNITLSSTTAATTVVTGCGTTSTSTLTATFTPNPYSVRFNANGGDGSMSNQNFTYDEAQNLTANAFTKTGYNFGGWATSQANADAGTKAYDDGESVSNLTTTKNGVYDLFAVWAPKTTTITYNQSGTGYGSGGQSTTQTATYDAAMPTPITTPTAANGYAFMGYYDALEPLGTQYYNANGTSAHVWDKEDATATLYAYFKKAEVTEIALSAATVEAEATVTATATISPTPVAPTKLCWYLLYNDGSLHPSQPSFVETGTANQVRFSAPAASGSYKVQAVLRTGSSCGGGTELSSYAAGFQVAGIHNVRISYKCGDKTVKASTTLEGIEPLEWSSEITPGDAPFGYTFQKWVAGDGVTITTDGGSTTVTETTSSTIKIQAIYDGELVAQYTKDNIIYFKNTLNWSEVWVNLLTNAWWDNSQGSGNKSLADDNRNKQMQLVPGTTNIYYYNYGSTGTTNYVSFTDRSQDNYHGFSGSADNPVKVVYPTRPTPAGASADTAAYGFNAGTPMFVPLAPQSAQPWNKVDGTDRANYYNKGYWRNYDPVLGEEGSTGYTLYVYNQTAGNNDRKVLYTVPFNNSDVDGQLFKASVELEGSKGYGIKFIRDNDWGYTNTTGHLNYTGDVEIMNKEDAENWAAVYILTTAADKYDFIITCSGKGQLCLQATFPVAEGDYRVIYTDNATWTPENGAHTARTWIHPSRAISAVANAVDTVSFWVKKGASPEYKIQKVQSINKESGAVKWQDVTEWTSCNDVTSTGVYNFIFTQNESKAISLTKKEAYEGEFYIRTDNAGSTKWDNYRTDDHKMTYSEYAAGLRHKESTNDFTHYFMKFVNKDIDGGKYKNVKFTIANDYSPCISDTLKQQTGDTSADPAYEHVDANGDLKANANIRFMWNQTDNTLKRAYLSPAKDDGTHFLVMQGQDTKLLDKNGDALRNASGKDEAGYNHKAPDNAIQFIDKENWMYEAEVQAVPGAYIKLYAKFDNGYFYFYGTNDATFDDSHAMKLITGTGTTPQKIRVVYDFKTDRLIAAWLPTDETLEEEYPINADIMIVREHQGPGQQINLTGDGSITAIKNVYGVMRFNRWTLNNKSTVNTGTEDNPVHEVLPVGDQKSQYERFNYFISFPFNVKVGEIFGFGQVGRHWRIFYYDGLGRAQEGFFAERGTDNWRMIADTDDELEANVGYLLQLNYVRMKDDNTSTWPQKQMNEVELYFPAKDNITAIDGDDVTIPALGDEYHCSIDLRSAYGGNPEADRTVKDSYWRCIGVPGFTSYKAYDTWTNFCWNLNADDVPYLYQWQMDDNKLNVVTANNFTFLPMHAYLIQNGNSFTWNNVSKPVISSIVARRAMTKEEEQYYEFRLDMRHGEQELDHTFIRLTNREDATTEFDFGQDLSKELSASYNIYSHVGYERLAANNLPLSEQTTVVPVGVTVSETGEFTFSMPEGTNGVSVILIDNATGEQTNLALYDHKVNLEAGDYDQRFMLEISPIQHISEGVDEVNGEGLEANGVRKVLIDNVLYIIRDGKVFDAQGKRLH